MSKSKNKEGKWIEYESYDEITVYPQGQDIIRTGELLRKRYLMWTEKKRFPSQYQHLLMTYR
ncbi:hypothetical protein DN407_31510 (plasmid) [Bacillus sp. JAS24-2]|nr:hypothetical protein DN407_31510 [Bacillus sp. JAS24-2]